MASVAEPSSLAVDHHDRNPPAGNQSIPQGSMCIGNRLEAAQMNELMRLLDKAIRPFGYDIRVRGRLNLLPFKGIAPTPEITRVRTNLNSISAPSGAKPNLNSVEIICRMCLTDERIAKSCIRLEGLQLDEVVERCFRSLVRSIHQAMPPFAEGVPQISLTIIDDHSDSVLLARVTSHAQYLSCPVTILPAKKSGQGWTLYEQFSMARDDDSLYYFVEDDYLHSPTAIFEMWEFYKQIYEASGDHCVIHPQEHESLYSRSHGPAYLVLSPYRHWRSANDATHCLFMHSQVVKTYWSYFENTKFVGSGAKRRLGSERRTTNRLFDHLPCFSPIPALAAHLQAENCLPPHFDWRALWDQFSPALGGQPKS
jgi:hypothetical protein